MHRMWRKRAEIFADVAQVIYRSVVCEPRCTSVRFVLHITINMMDPCFEQWKREEWILRISSIMDRRHDATTIRNRMIRFSKIETRSRDYIEII